ncbi:MAG: Gfo/Idh/MocA family oxidoreductase [Proteobacteria bacterium]|nr:Gfo/Idh/MocA family oxidoreductase [Pseudomonadota bacterium]
MEPLKVALVGAGAVAAEAHLPVLAELEDARAVALVDRDEDRARALATRFSVDRHGTDLDAVLAEAQPDVVHVLTPPESHRELACRCLEAGAHVLIEKPFAYTTAEADAVIETAKATGRRFSVVHNELYFEPVFELHRRVRAGEIGTLCSVDFVSGRRNQAFVPDRWYFTTRGGRLGETLPHALYQLIEFFDDLEVQHVQTARLGHCIPPSGVDSEAVDLDELRVSLASRGSGATAHIHYSLNSELPTALLASGTKGTLVAHPFRDVSPWTFDRIGLRDLVKTLPQWQDAALRKLRLRRETPRQKLRSSPHFLQIREFLAAVRSGAEFGVTASKARETVRLWQDVVDRYAGA